MPAKRQTIRDHSAEANLFARRAFVSSIFVVFFMGLILVNLYDLQINQHEDYQTRSNGNRIKLLPVAPNRGIIYDRNGVILAENRPVFSLEIILEQVTDLDATIDELAKVMSLTDEELERFDVERRASSRFKPIPIRKQLSHEEVATFSVHQHKFAGVSIGARLSRYYPYKDTLTHLLGYVSRINKRDQERLEAEGQKANYADTQHIGKQGVERYYETLLHGKVGYQQVEVNNQGRIVRILDFQPPIPGQDIVLNVDIDLQKKVQEQLEGKRGAIVVSDPRNGGILALYSSPSYDPNLFVDGISQKDYSKLLNSRYSPLLNRVTQGRYPPASTIKPHLALLGLEKGVIDAETKIRDFGTYRLRNVDHTWRDWKKGGHGVVDVVKSVEVSCDTFFYDLAYKLGIDNIHEGMSAFGFGEYTGIDLKEESAALMPSRGWKRARHNEPWYIGDTIPVGIGQSYWNATPLQIVQSLNTLVNKGVKHTPRLLKAYAQENQFVDQAIESQRVVEVVEEKNWDLILDSLYGTVNREHGTARNAFKKTEYISAGKTGTAQLFTVGQDEEYEEENVSYYLRDNAMYVGYAPYDSPEISMAIAVENAGGGSSNAAPVARTLMDFYFEQQKGLLSDSEAKDAKVAQASNAISTSVASR